ncbi:MAG: 5'/3'-nucleotidase SurE [Dialister sp.]|nr:5'/3'-nucleotidase SurE [Dialister sp.]
MHIFLTNDDGFESPGIISLARKLSALGRVTVIAPNRGRSSCSSSLTLQEYLRLWHKESYGENITVLTASGTTADCCKLALDRWIADDLPDLIVSGINNGWNLGSDCLYSGTVAGAMEGIFFGISSIAISAETIKKEALLERAASFSAELVKTFFIDGNYKGILNVNIPALPLEDIGWERVKTVRLGLQKYDNVIRQMKDPSGHLGFWLHGKPIPGTDKTTDVYWAHKGWITVTPLMWDQTDQDKLSLVAQTVDAQLTKESKL